MVCVSTGMRLLWRSLLCSRTNWCGVYDERLPTCRRFPTRVLLYTHAEVRKRSNNMARLGVSGMNDRIDRYLARLMQGIERITRSESGDAMVYDAPRPKLTIVRAKAHPDPSIAPASPCSEVLPRAPLLRLVARKP